MVALFLEVTKLAPLVKAEYDLLMVRYRRVRHLLAPAYMIEGMLNVTIAAYSVESKTEIEVSEKNLFGIRVPVITGSNVRTDLVDRGYGLLGTSLVIDDMADAYEKLVDAIIAYDRNAAALNHLITEIERISRRVKALEHVVYHHSKRLSQRLRQAEKSRSGKRRRVGHRGKNSAD